MEETDSSKVEQNEAHDIQSNNELENMTKRRGVQVKLKTDDVSECLLSQNYNDNLDIEPNTKLENKSGFKSSITVSIGGIKSEENTGLNFSTKSDSKGKDADIITSSTPSTVIKSKKTSKYFDSVDGEEMTRRVTEMQIENPALFMQVMLTGGKLVKCAEENDIPGFHSLIIEAPNKNLLFWHVSKAFK